jgi:hypothetical protein
MLVVFVEVPTQLASAATGYPTVAKLWTCATVIFAHFGTSLVTHPLSADSDMQFVVVTTAYVLIVLVRSLF